MSTFRTRCAALGAFTACLIAATAGASTLSVNPIADAFVTTGPSSNLSGNNYGGAGALGISGSAATKGIFDSVIRFDLSSIKAGFDTTYGVGQWAVQSITLQLTASSPNNAIFNAQANGQFSIVWMQNDTWIEGSGSPNSPGGTGITYTSLPTYLGVNDQILGTFNFNATTSGADGTNSSYTFALTGGILSDIGTGSLTSIELLAATSGTSFLFNSSNFGLAPRRPLLTVVAVPEPASLPLLGIGCVLIALLRLPRSRNARAPRLLSRFRRTENQPALPAAGIGNGD